MKPLPLVFTDPCGAHARGMGGPAEHGEYPGKQPHAPVVGSLCSFRPRDGTFSLEKNMIIGLLK